MIRDVNTQTMYIYYKKQMGLSNVELFELKKYLFAAGPEPKWVPEYLCDKEWLADYFDEELNKGDET